MNTKLTLSIDGNTIEKAKIFARKRHKSLSRLVENYLKAVTQENADKGGITPLVTELSGVLSAGDEQRSRHADYAAYLAEKYR